MSTKYRVQGISFPNEAIYQAARAKARSQRRSLSNYVCGLVEADLGPALKDHPQPAAPHPSLSKASEVSDDKARRIVYSVHRKHKPAT